MEQHADRMNPSEPAWRFCVAPMMDWTDRHCRVFHRILSRHARLYTEMLTAEAVIHGPRERLLGFDVSEHPVAVQLGGCEPAKLAQAARICAEFGYDEINLNCGCPSDRVQSGAFGACLMREPERVGECVGAMRGAVKLPVTVKCRLGVDDQDPQTALWRLTDCVQAAGAAALIVHARKAWLRGLSPRENRTVPPLDYALVERLKADRPELTIAVNGGVATVAEARLRFPALDGVMVGRAAYQTPEMLLAVDPELFGQMAPVRDGFEALDAFEPYVADWLRRGAPLSGLTAPLLGLFAGRPGARSWRRRLTEGSRSRSAGLETLRDARALVSREAPASTAAHHESRVLDRVAL